MLADGLALAQASAPAQGPLHIQHWHWLALQDAPKMQHSLLAGWPEPSWLRMACQQAGCAAQDAALAIEEARLRRFSLQLQSGLNVREQVKAIELELQRQMPWPLSDTVWDFHCLAAPAGPTLAEPHQRPDWLVAAIQAQAVQHVEVLATQRAWVATLQAMPHPTGQHAPAWVALSASGVQVQTADGLNQQLWSGSVPSLLLAWQRLVELAPHARVSTFVLKVDLAVLAA